MNEVAAMVLTGGRSIRLGRDKATLPAPGGTLAGQVARVVSNGVAGPVIEVGPGVTGLTAVAEHPAGQGPLAGLVAGARELDRLGHGGPFLVVACDLPNLSSEVVRALASELGCCVPVVRGRVQPLCARYDPETASVASRLLEAGHRAMHRLLDQLSVTYLDEPWWSRFTTEAAFFDIDTPGDLAASGLAP